MPAVAIIGAGAAWALGGGAAIGAVVAGTATLATTLTAVATVGATLGAVGAITGNKTLSTVGMVMGAVGGVGALAANAGLFGEAATTESLFGTTASATVQAPDIAADVANSNDLSSLSTLPDLPGVGAETGVTAGTDALSQTGEFAANSVLPTQALDTMTQTASGDAGGLINSSPGGNSLKTIVGQNVDDATNQLVPGSGGGTLPSGSPTDAASIAKAGSPAEPMADGVTAPPPPAVGGSLPDVKIPGQTYVGADGNTYVSDGTRWAPQTGFWGGLMKSPMAQYGMIQAGGALISGLFDPLKPAQVDALNAQAAANRAQASITSQQAANMAGPLPVASRTPGAAPTPPTGLINSPAITGKVAA